jgi:hypothetical protein
MNENLTNIDFSKHELTITEHGDFTVYELKKPSTVIHGITFICGKGITTVTGDFGNWVFCREFHPSPNEGVSRCYWDEKLTILSSQRCENYDDETTLKEIQEFKNNFPYNYDREMNEEEIDWVEQLEENLFDEIDYTTVAYRQKPSTIDYDSIPFGKKRHHWLEVIYDAFNIICGILNKEELKKLN